MVGIDSHQGKRALCHGLKVNIMGDHCGSDSSAVMKLSRHVDSSSSTIANVTRVTNSDESLGTRDPFEQQFFNQPRQLRSQQKQQQQQQEFEVQALSSVPLYSDQRPTASSWMAEYNLVDIDDQQPEPRTEDTIAAGTLRHITGNDYITFQGLEPGQRELGGNGQPQLLDAALINFSANTVSDKEDSGGDSSTTSSNKVNLRSLSQKFLAAYQTLDNEAVKLILDTTDRLMVPLGFNLTVSLSNGTTDRAMKANKRLDTVNNLIASRLQAGSLKFINSASQL